MNIYRWAKTLGLSERSITQLYNQFVIIKNLIKYGDPYFIKGVSIETSTYCNRKCSYCPNSFTQTPRLYMDQAVFDKIINNLVEIRFTGFVNYHFYNEPLLDSRLPALISIAKQALPKAFHRIYTNGDYLTGEIAEACIQAGISSFFVTNHSLDAEGFNKRIEPLVHRYKSYIHINELRIHEDHDSRAGLIKTGRPLLQSCSLYNNLQITYTGDVILCCNDYYRKHVFGNVMNSSLLEIWRLSAYVNLRNQIRKGQYALDICRKCMQK